MELLLGILREVRDPRDVNARHCCPAMLFIALMAVLCGAKTCVDIADFAAANEDDLALLVDLPHGAPSHDSFSRLFRLLDPDEMAKAFAHFAQALREGLGLPAAQGVVAIDGKRLRRGYERGRSFMPPLMVSVWDAETRLSLAAQASGDGNEVKAALEALKSLDLKGCTVTADALHCHPKMAAAILAAGAHYALKLKGNNGPLHACAVAAFKTVNSKAACYETSESGHDRVERRRVNLIAAPKDAALACQVLSCSRASKANGAPMARRRPSAITWLYPSACRRARSWKRSGCIGASKTSSIGRSMWSSTKIRRARAKTTPRTTLPSSGVWP
jgi:predicted transposase YbfD/YdcC